MDKVTPTEAKVRQWENKFPFKSISQKPNFMPASRQVQDGLPTFVRANPPSNPGNQGQADAQSSASTFQSFGGSGVRIGDGAVSSGSGVSGAMDRLRGGLNSFRSNQSAQSTTQPQANGQTGGYHWSLAGKV